MSNDHSDIQIGARVRFRDGNDVLEGTVAKLHGGSLVIVRVGASVPRRSYLVDRYSLKVLERHEA